ncbi:hypothetical protein, partial [Streptomyces flavochromogenes]|uniref:hypothetical protein n=1 Tax=Streptomyces flavochromogenes TaxID=68199 RepID=UPI001ADF52A0
MITVADTATGTSGSRTDHSRGHHPGRRAHHTPVPAMTKGPNGTHSTTGTNSTAHHSSEKPNIIEAPQARRA